MYVPSPVYVDRTTEGGGRLLRQGWKRGVLP